MFLRWLGGTVIGGVLGLIAGMNIVTGRHGVVDEIAGIAMMFFLVGAGAIVGGGLSVMIGLNDSRK